jgi:hypothetical protein
MTYKKIIRKYIDELPCQINILEKEYAKTPDKKEYQKKVEDLKLYEQRMLEGLNYLNNIKDKKIIKIINKINDPTSKLLTDNKKRYLLALKNYRKKNNIIASKKQINCLLDELKEIKLVHTTKSPEIIKTGGIKPASDLWLTSNKSCANAMDVVLGLDKCAFLNHGFSLDNFSDAFVEVNSKIIDNKSTIVSSLDLFTFVLIKTKKIAPCSIQTKKWISSLEDYSKNLFYGKDFLQIKAEYILTFFKSIDEYNSFAKKNYYINKITKAPKNEFPFLGEIKIFRYIKSNEIL